MSTTAQKVIVTKRPGAPRDKSVLDTPAGTRDVKIVAMSWWKQVLIRTARTYLQNLVGNLTNVGIAGSVAVTAFANLSPAEQETLQRAWSALEFYQMFLIAASTAVAPAVITLLQNAVELLGQLDNPQTRA